MSISCAVHIARKCSQVSKPRNTTNGSLSEMFPRWWNPKLRACVEKAFPSFPFFHFHDSAKQGSSGVRLVSLPRVGLLRLRTSGEDVFAAIPLFCRKFNCRAKKPLPCPPAVWPHRCNRQKSAMGCPPSLPSSVCHRARGSLARRYAT